MTARQRQLGYPIAIVGVLAVCWLATTRSSRMKQTNTISREDLARNIENSLATLDNFCGKVTLIQVGDGKPTQIVYDVVSKGESRMYVKGKLNGDPSLSFVSKGDKSWVLPKPGGKLDAVTSSGTAVASHPSMQSFLSGVLYGLKDSNFHYTASRTEVGRLRVSLTLTNPKSELVYEIDPKTFYVIKQHANGPHGTANTTWTDIDTHSTVSEDFFDNKLEELKRIASHDNVTLEDAQPQAAASGIPSAEP